MSKLAATLVSGVLLLTAGGCMSTTLGTYAEAAPAVVQMNAAYKQQLENAASQLLYGREIRFTASAFTTSNTLSIERTQAVDNRGLLVNGRETKPEVIVFSLWIDNQQCWLKREDTAKTVTLDAVVCKRVDDM